MNYGWRPLAQAAPVSWCSGTAEGLFASLPLSLTLSVCERVSVCDPLAEVSPRRPLTSPPSVPSSTPSLPSVCPAPSYLPSLRHPLSLSFFLSPPLCTCDWETLSQTLLAFSRSLRPPGSYSITEKKAEISYRRYTCAWCECQILSQ